MTESVFISYASIDQELAFWVRDWFDYEGISYWIAPDSIAPGSDYPSSIIKAIENCDVFLLVFSEHSNESSHVAREIERAANRGVPIIPFFVDNTKPTAAMEYFLSNRQWILVSSPPEENDITKLVDTVRENLETAPDAIANTAKRKKKPKKSPYSRFKPFAFGIGASSALFSVGFLILMFVFSEDKKVSSSSRDAISWSNWIPAPFEPRIPPNIKLPQPIDSPLDTDINQQSHETKHWENTLNKANELSLDDFIDLAGDFHKETPNPEAYQLQFVNLLRGLMVDYDDKIKKLKNAEMKRYESEKKKIINKDINTTQRLLYNQIVDLTNQISELDTKKKKLENSLTSTQEKISSNREVGEVADTFIPKVNPFSSANKSRKEELAIFERKINEVNRQRAQLYSEYKSKKAEYTRSIQSRDDNNKRELERIKAIHNDKLSKIEKQVSKEKQDYLDTLMEFLVEQRNKLRINVVLVLGKYAVKTFPRLAEFASITQDALDLKRRINELKRKSAQEINAVVNLEKENKLWTAFNTLKDVESQLLDQTKNTIEDKVVLSELAPLSSNIIQKMQKAISINKMIIDKSVNDAEQALSDYSEFKQTYPDWPIAMRQQTYLEKLSQEQRRGILLDIKQRFEPDLQVVKGWLMRYSGRIPANWKIEGLPQPKSSSSDELDFLIRAKNEQNDIITKISSTEQIISNAEVRHKLSQIKSLEQKGLNQIDYTINRIKDNQRFQFYIYLTSILAVIAGAGVAYWRWKVAQALKRDAE